MQPPQVAIHDDGFLYGQDTLACFISMTIHTQALRNGVGALGQATSEDEVMFLAKFGPVSSQQDYILPLHENNRFNCCQYIHFVALDEPLKNQLPGVF